MSSRSITTTNHDEIAEWVERHGGVPCRVRGEGGALRIDFPQDAEELEPLDWDHWFKQFDHDQLALNYELEAPGHRPRRLAKLVHSRRQPAPAGVGLSSLAALLAVARQHRR